MSKPLFIPLKTQYYAAFAEGRKTEEYRLYGPRSNERTCHLGRQVTLSRGYGKQNRLTAVITGFRKSSEPQDLTPAFLECYPKAQNPEVAVITLNLGFTS